MSLMTVQEKIKALNKTADSTSKENDKKELNDYRKTNSKPIKDTKPQLKELEKSSTVKDSITPFDLENENNKEKEKKKVYVETNEHIRNRVKIFEDREKKNKSLKEELDYRQKVYEQNRAKTRERMRKLKQFLKEKKDNTKTNEEFFEINKEFFFQNGVKSYDELLKLIHNFDKENIEEIEREILEKYKKKFKNRKTVI
jgi:hypothetical protein